MSDIVPLEGEIVSDEEIVREKLAECEDIIARAMKSFVEIGNALKKIHDERLYRLHYSTFDDYCVDRWQFKRKRAYQLMSGAGVVSTIVDTVLPTKESHARELARAPEDMRAEIWTVVLAETEFKPTASAVKTVVERFTGMDNEALEAAEKALQEEAERQADEEERATTKTLMARIAKMDAAGATPNQIAEVSRNSIKPPPPPPPKLDAIRQPKRVTEIAKEFLRDLDKLDPKDYNVAMTFWAEAVVAVENVANACEKLSQGHNQR